MARYRKTTVAEVDAVHWDGTEESADRLCDELMGVFAEGIVAQLGDSPHLVIEFIDECEPASVQMYPNEWLVRDENNIVRVLTADEFDASYEAAS